MGPADLVWKVRSTHPAFILADMVIFAMWSLKSADELMFTPRSLTICLASISVPRFDLYAELCFIASLGPYLRHSNLSGLN